MRSLRSRLILSHIVPMLVIIPVVGVILVYLLETQILLSGMAGDLTRQAVLVAEVAGDYTEIWYNPDRAQAFVHRIGPGLTGKVMLLDSTGRLVVSSDPADNNLVGQIFEIPNVRSMLAQGAQAEVHYQDSEIVDVSVPVFAMDGSLLGFVRVTNPLASVYERSQNLRRISLWVLGGGLLLGVILGWVLATDLTRPLKKATQAVYMLSSGQQYEPLEEKGPEEIRILMRAFNSLTEQLETLEQNRQRLLANLVHELGRPLGALHSAIQALLGGAEDDAVLRKELLHGMDDELGRLQHLLEDLSHLHDRVIGTLELDRKDANLSEWLGRVIAPWRQAAQEKGIEFQSTYPMDLPVLQIDSDRLGQAVSNLVSNAIRYTASGGKVIVDAGIQDSDVYFRIRDTGPGVSIEEQSRIFAPFYRGKAAKRFTKGMGLGLTIAQDLVAAHGGQLTLESTSSQGSSFLILVPLHPEIFGE